MSNFRNRVQLIGNLGREPDVMEFNGGRKLAKFSLATSESYQKENGDKVKETQWHNLVAWGNTAKYAEKILKKGVEVAVEGKLTTRSYEDKEGHKKFISEIVVSDIMLIKGKE